jgi:hypothetical protein
MSREIPRRAKCILTQQLGDGSLLIENVMSDIWIPAVPVGQLEQPRVLLVLLAGRHGVQFT